MLAAPAVVWLRKHRVPTVVAVLLVVLALLVVLSAFGALVGGSVTAFTEAVPRYQARFKLLGDQLKTWLQLRGVRVGGASFSDILNPGAALRFLGATLGGLVSAASNTLLVLLTTIFILFELAGFPDKLRVVLGDDAADLSRFYRATVEVQRYLLLKTALSLGTGLLAGVWCALLGVDFALLWGLLAFLLNYIPNLGSIIAAVPAVLLALVQLGVGPALGVAAGYVVINTLIGSLLEPQLMGRRLGLSPLIVFLSLVFWGWVWGPVGMLLSVPLTMMVKIMLETSPNFWRVGVLLDTTARAEAALDRLKGAGPGESSRPPSGSEPPASRTSGG